MDFGCNFGPSYIYIYNTGAINPTWNAWLDLWFFGCHVPLHEECLKHHGRKGDPGVTPGTCGAIGPSDPSVGEGPWCKERLPPTKTRSYKGMAISYT